MSSRKQQLVAKLGRLWNDPPDQIQLADLISRLDTRHSLGSKIAREPGVEDIIGQMLGRLAHSFGSMSAIKDKKILDIACGSNTSKAPAGIHIDTPFGRKTIGRPRQGFTAQFEPWFCRILVELGASPVGVDFGDLESEVFVHYQVDLGRPGSLDFLPDHTFDALQDSRLFGSPEFTAQFPKRLDRVKVAQEIRRQEQRLLKTNGIVIHSDAEALLG